MSDRSGESGGIRAGFPAADHSEAVADVVVEHDVECVVRDGTVLRADVYHPEDGGRYPTLVVRTPYDKSIPRTTDVAHRLAGSGYTVVAQDSRGRFKSDGDFHWMFGDSELTSEGADGFDAIEWAASLPWSTGAVGAYGHSYDAWMVWMMLRMRPPSLVAAFVSGMTRTLRDFTFGQFETGRRLEWTYQMAATDPGEPDGPSLTRPEATRRWKDVERGKYIWWLPLSEIPRSVFGELTEQYQAYLRNCHLKAWDFDSHFPHVSVPVMQMTGWWDRLVGTVDNYRGLIESGPSQLRSEHRLLVGPWGHSTNELTGTLGPIDYGQAANADYVKVVSRWFDFHLKGVDTGLAAEPPVRVFVLGENRWRGLSQWPPQHSELTLLLDSGGKANSAFGDGSLRSEIAGQVDAHLGAPRPDATGSDVDEFVYDPRDPVMSLAREDSQSLPVDQSPHDDRDDVLFYETGPLLADLEVLGSPELVLWAATDGPDTDWVGRLVVVMEDGRAVNLTHGFVRARFRHGFDVPELLVPGAVVEYRIGFLPIATRFLPGQRIRLCVTSSDFPNFDRNHNTGAEFWCDAELRSARQRVLHSSEYPSRLILPAPDDAVSR